MYATEELKILQTLPTKAQAFQGDQGYVLHLTNAFENYVHHSYKGTWLNGCFAMNNFFGSCLDFFVV